MPKPVIVIVIDGLTPSTFEAAATPAIRFLAEHGEYRRAASVLISSAYSSYFSCAVPLRPRTACCSSAIVSGFHMWCSPSRRHA